MAARPWIALVALLSAVLAAAGPADVTIADIQGPGPASPLDGRQVRFDGVVTGNFTGTREADGDLGGFYVQSEAGRGVTAFGVFVYTGRKAVAVSRGDRVTVEGRVREFHGETQIEAAHVRTTGRGDAEPVSLALPADGIVANADGYPVADLERYEGLLVRIDGPLVVSESRDLERFGELRLAAGDRPLAFTQLNAPSAAGFAAHLESLAARSIRLDDGSRAENVRPIRYLADRVIRAGDRVTALTGNLRYARGSGGSGAEGWRLVPTEAPAFEHANPRPPVPPGDGGLRIAIVNAQNYFATPADGGDRCGPRRASRCRGADTRRELGRQLDKLAAALEMLDADIVGIVELENDAANRSLATLVAAVNERAPERAYDFIATGPIGADAIRVGLVYRPGRVAISGRPATLTSADDPRYDVRRNRPALAQTFRHASVGAVTVIVAHLKSKGSDCEADGDPDRGDGQGNCNRTRTRAAAALADWALAGPTGADDDGHTILIGDLNAYPREDPLAEFGKRGFVDLVAAAGDTYTYVFDGQAGRLDYALATPALAKRVHAAGVWHVNADEPRAHDYNLEYGRDPGIFDASQPYRFSDHDPVVIGISTYR